MVSCGFLSRKAQNKLVHKQTQTAVPWLDIPCITWDPWGRRNQHQTGPQPSLQKMRQMWFLGCFISSRTLLKQEHPTIWSGASTSSMIRHSGGDRSGTWPRDQRKWQPSCLQGSPSKGEAASWYLAGPLHLKLPHTALKQFQSWTPSLSSH